MGSNRIKTGSRKNGRNKPSVVSILFPYFFVNTKTVRSNVENGMGRSEILSVRFQPYAQAYGAQTVSHSWPYHRLGALVVTLFVWF
jgi:hypothetical protein